MFSERKQPKMNTLDIEKRFAEINAMELEALTEEDAASLAEAEAMDDGTTVSLEEYKLAL